MKFEDYTMTMDSFYSQYKSRARALFAGALIAGSIAVPLFAAAAPFNGFTRGVNIDNFHFPKDIWNDTVRKAYELDYNLMRDANLRIVRVMVDWGANVTNNGNIKPEFLDEVEKEVLKIQGMNKPVGSSEYGNLNHVILTFYGFENELSASKTDAELNANKDRLKKWWVQIARKFGGHRPSRLSYEVFNEPNAVATATPEKALTYEKWNAIQQEVVREIRKTPAAIGGSVAYNASRSIVVTGAEWGNIVGLIDPATKALRFAPVRLANGQVDPNQVVSFHYYAPHSFTHEGIDSGSMRRDQYGAPNGGYAPYGSCGWVGSVWPGEQKNTNMMTHGLTDIQKDFALVKEAQAKWKTQFGVSLPLFLGEFGAVRATDCRDLSAYGDISKLTAEEQQRIKNLYEYNKNYRVSPDNILQRFEWEKAVRDAAVANNIPWTVYAWNNWGFGIQDIFKTHGVWDGETTPTHTPQIQFSEYGWKLFDQLKGPLALKSNNGDVDRDGQLTVSDATMARKLANLEGMWARMMTCTNSTEKKLPDGRRICVNASEAEVPPIPVTDQAKWDEVKNANQWRADVDRDGTVKQVDALSLLEAATKTLDPKNTNMSNFTLRVPPVKIRTKQLDVNGNPITGGGGYLAGGGIVKADMLEREDADRNNAVLLLTAQPASDFQLPVKTVDSKPVNLPVWEGVTCETDPTALRTLQGRTGIDLTSVGGMRRNCVLRNIPYATGMSTTATVNFQNPRVGAAQVATRDAKSTATAVAATIVLLGGVPLGAYYLVKRRNRVSVDAAPPTVQ